MTCAVRGAVLYLSAILAMGGTTAQSEPCALLDAIQSGEIHAPPLADATCQTYVTLGGNTASSCFWTFALDAPEATVFADDLWMETKTCMPGTEGRRDQPVNHPDSYELNQWRTSQGTFAVSQKRKGALRQTLVHLRFEPSDAG